MRLDKDIAELSVVIVGLGSAGRRHLRNLVTLGVKEITLVRSGLSTLPDAELAAYPQEKELEVALKRKPDIVVIANPTALHIVTALAAAEAGCHLFIEKPLSHSLEGVERLQTIVRKKNLKAMIGFQLRFDPSLGMIREWLQQGAIGAPVAALAVYAEYMPGWHPWEDYRQSYSGRSDLGGGVLFTLCHPLDYLLWLFGPLEQMQAQAGCLGGLEIDTEDIVQLALRFRAPLLASVHLDYLCRPFRHDLHIIGREGSIRWNAYTFTAQLYRADRTEPIVYRPEPFERNDLFLREMNHLLHCLLTDADPSPDLQQGVSVLEWLVQARHLLSQEKPS